MDNRINHYGNEVLSWKEYDLYFQDNLLVTLVPSTKYLDHYHLKFIWRDKITPEFFNIFNARENARRIALHRLNYDTWQRRQGAPYSDLN